MTDPHLSGEDPEAELVPEDDAIIGVAFRRSLVVLLSLLAVVAAVIYLRGGAAGPEVVLEKDAGEIADNVTDVAVLPAVKFTDVTASAGIDFVHFDGATGEKLLPETMGGGAAFFDYDDDGDQDLLFVNGAPWPQDRNGDASPSHRLYANDGRGRFEDVTRDAGLVDSSYGMGAAVGDYDGDGRLDLFLTGIGGNHLYRNVPGGFEDVTERARVGGDPEAWSTSAGFFDMENDGDLDLFVCNYVQWSQEIDTALAFSLNGTDRAYGPPTSYRGSYSTLFENRGDGTFRDVSKEAGIFVDGATGEAMGKALALAFADFDRDGLTDVMVANDTVQNFLFHNLGGGKFEELGAIVGVGFSGNGKATGAMGIDVGDFRGDGGYGVCIGNFANEMSSLYVAAPDKFRFTDDAMGEGIGSPSRQRLSFGLFFFDYDLDGRLDLLQVNGHLEESINEVQPSQHYHQPPQLFWNAGADQRSCFVEVPPDAAGDLITELAGRGSSFADIDGDGDQDVLLCQVGAKPVLLRNDQALGHHWLRVKLVGKAPNTHAYGAVVEARVGERVLRRILTPTKSYLSQSELPLTFGLGTASAVDGLEVRWPDGTRQTVPVAGIDRELVVTQPK